jgi:polyisoprenoid-binding protein YceI
MHDWTGTSRNVTGTLVLDAEAPERSRAVIRAPVASFESGPDRRDRKMREVTEAKTYPIVELRTREIRSVRWGRTSEGHAGRWTVTGALTFHGQTHPVEATVDVRITDDSVHAHAQFPVSLTRFGVERPELLWVAPIADTIRIDARIAGAIQEPATAAERLDTTQNRLTGTRRVASTDLRNVAVRRYAGRRAGLHAAVRTPSEGRREWVVAVFGFADRPTGLSDAQEIALRADEEPVDPLRSTGTTRRLEDGTTVEITRLYFSRSAFTTLAEALTVTATVGPARFAVPWQARRDLRLILEEVSSPSPGRVSANENN